MLRSMALKDLNPNIMCVLCSGYLVDATTIIECLHSYQSAHKQLLDNFCRCCIVRWLQTSYHCPVCDTEVHKTRPFLNIRPDNVLQDIVYKLVPGLYDRELQNRKDFQEEVEKSEESEQPQCSKEDEAGDEKKQDDIIDDPVCLTLEYYGAKRNRKEKSVFPTRYLRCSSKMSISVLKKFVVMKFSIPRTHQTEIVRSDEILSEHLTMKELSTIYGLHSKSFLDLQYVFMGMEKETNEDTAHKHKKFKPCTTEEKKTHQKKSKAIAVEDKINLKNAQMSAANSPKVSPTCSQQNQIKNGITGLVPTNDHTLSTNETATSLLTSKVSSCECPDTPESDKQEPESFPACSTVTTAAIVQAEGGQVEMSAVE